jgi:hypothetical protein
VHQLDLITDLLGTPSMDTISRVIFFFFYRENVSCIAYALLCDNLRIVCRYAMIKQGDT